MASSQKRNFSFAFSVFVLCTSAIVTPCSATAEAVQPAGSSPKLIISGQSTFNAWWFNNHQQKFRNDGNFGDSNPVAAPAPTGDTQVGYGRGYLFTMDDARIKFDLTGKTDAEMEYGLTVIMNADTEQTTYDKTIKENYIWAGGLWGRLTMGDTDGVEDIMAFGGFDPLGGTGGFDGNFDRVVNFVTGTVTSVDLVGDTGKSTKVMYQTPRYYGFQAGISFTPQTQHLGEAEIDSARYYQNTQGYYPFDRRSIAVGLNFLNEWKNGFEWGLSGTALFAKTQPGFTGGDWHLIDQDTQVTFLDNTVSGSQNRRNTAAYAIGTLLRYAGFEFGVEYANNGKSHEIKDVKAKTGIETNAGWFVDYGLAYNWGPTKISIGHFYSKRKALGLNPIGSSTQFFKAKNRTQIFSASIDHKVAPGVGIYLEYAHYDMKNEGFNVDAMIQNSANLAPVTGGGYTAASLGAFTGPVGPKQKSDAFVLGTKVKF